MGVSILGVTAIDSVALGSGKGKEQPLDRLLHTGGVGGSHSMKGRCIPGGTITAIATGAGAIGFDIVLPVGTENNGSTGPWNGVTKHTKFQELV